MRLVFATSNKGKLREAQEILGGAYQIISASQAGVQGEAVEDADTLAGNSLLKAEYVQRELGPSEICFADDSGLEVDALGGAPWVHTARYAGEECDFDKNMDKLLRELGELPMEQRTARFKCVVTLLKDSEKYVFEGSLEGYIAFQKSGERGFGYDPVFIPKGYEGRSLAELGEELKNTISHRFKALSLMSKVLEEL
ncbi:MAG: RdgB/HAM1 family non-canonical purine NTP pyrophosphatase [Candidatus Cryptobacteroides sp.]